MVKTILPDNFTQEQIDNYFNNLENTQPEEVTEEAEEEKRGLLTDIPAQAIGGLFDAGKSAVRLIEGVAQDAKRYWLWWLDIWRKR